MSPDPSAFTIQLWAKNKMVISRRMKVLPTSYSFFGFVGMASIKPQYYSMKMW
jgi:hypothetical protein